MNTCLSVGLDALFALFAHFDERTRAALDALPFDERAFRDDAGVLPSSRLGGDARLPVYERLWLRPAVAVTVVCFAPVSA